MELSPKKPQISVCVPVLWPIISAQSLGQRDSALQFQQGPVL